MPIVFELIVLMLVAYGAGLALGWVIWGRAMRIEAEPDHGAAGERKREE